MIAQLIAWLVGLLLAASSIAATMGPPHTTLGSASGEPATVGVSGSGNGNAMGATAPMTAFSPDPNSPSYPIELPLEACGTPVPEDTIACTDYGPDPDGWTPDPLWTMPPDWVHCVALDPFTGLPMFDYWQAYPCEPNLTPDPTP